MILTGKAKDDFLYWNHHKKNNDHGYIDIEPRSVIIGFSDIDDILQYTLIIDWLDSVGIYINIEPSIPIGWENTDCFTYRVNKQVNRFKYKSRHEATKQAILKANEIYNEI